MKRYLFIIISILLACGAGYAETHVPGGAVAGTWMVAGSPYLVEGTIGIRPGTLLTIEPGVEIIFQRHFKFLVYGQLLAMGTEADSITFTAADTTHGWHGFRFYNLSTQPDSSKLVYCKISYGRSSSDNNAGEDKHGGAIYCNNSDKLLISHCLIWNNRTGDVWGADGWNGQNSGDDGGPGESVSSGYGGAIYLNFSSAMIVNNNFYYNRTGNATGGNGGHGAGDSGWNTGANGGEGGDGGNGETGNGGEIYCIDSVPIIFVNEFSNNTTGNGTGGNGGWGGSAWCNGNWFACGGAGGRGGDGNAGSGGVVYIQGSNIALENNLFIHNETGGGEGGNGGNGGDGENWESGRGIAGNGGDGGNGYGGDGCSIYLSSSDTFISNMTACQNTNGQYVAGQGGEHGYGTYGWPTPGDPGVGSEGQAVVYCYSGSDLLMSNCIIWNNLSQATFGNPTIQYSCIEGGYPGTGNITTNPLFTSGTGRDFYLSQLAAGQLEQSPCVDAGDPDFNLFPGTTRTDGVLDTGVVDMGYHCYTFIPEPFLSVSPANFSFKAAVNAGNPEPQTFYITNPFTGSYNYEITESVDWLSVSPMSGGPILPGTIDTVSISVDISGLEPGIYNGEITITAAGAVGNPALVNVTLSLGELILVVEPDSLAFSTGTGWGNPPGQSFTISNTGILTFEYTIYDSVDWLTVSPMSGGPVPPTDTVTVSVDISVLEPGFYNGTIWVEVLEAIGSPQAIAVSLQLDATNPGLSGALNGTIASGIYDVIANIEVQSDDSLVLEPGTTFLFQGDHKFSIIGKLLAIGTVSDSITFKPAEGVDGWNGIRIIGSNSDTTTLEYCNVTGCDSVGLYISEASPAVRNCHIYQNQGLYRGAGIYCRYCNMTFDTCLIESNTISWGEALGGGVYCRNSNMNFNSCIIYNNSLIGDEIRGGGAYCYQGTYNFYNCTFEGNWLDGTSSRGGAVYCLYSTTNFAKCTFIDNWFEGSGWGGSAISCSSHETYLLNCTISNNRIEGGGGYWGGAILVYSSTDLFEIKNCIIEGNEDGGVYLQEDIDSLSIQYNDFFNNSGENIMGEVPVDFGLLVITNLNGDSCDIFYNIFEDPIFVFPDTSNYNLQAHSPCIDAGDPESPLDPDSTIADMGAFYFPHHPPSSIGDEDEINIPEDYCLFPPYPNPFNPVTTIRFGLPVGCWVKLEVFDVTGRLTESPLQGFREAGYHEVTFDASRLASGIYFYRIQAEDFSDVKKMVLVK